MGGQRLPLEVVQARGSKHLTKAEIKERQEREIKPITDNIIAPAYLTKKQKNEFYTISEQLQKLKIMGETDVDALARYIIAQNFYTDTIKAIRNLPKEKPKKEEFSNVSEYYSNLEIWYTRGAILDRRQERYFKQCRSSANDLGLSISSRCKLVVPETKPETPKENKFKQFEKGAAKK